MPNPPPQPILPRVRSAAGEHLPVGSGFFSGAVAVAGAGGHVPGSGWGSSPPHPWAPSVNLAGNSSSSTWPLLGLHPGAPSSVTLPSGHHAVPAAPYFHAGVLPPGVAGQIYVQPGNFVGTTGFFPGNLLWHGTDPAMVQGSSGPFQALMHDMSARSNVGCRVGFPTKVPIVHEITQVDKLVLAEDVDPVYPRNAKAASCYAVGKEQNKSGSTEGDNVGDGQGTDAAAVADGNLGNLGYVPDGEEESSEDSGSDDDEEEEDYIVQDDEEDDEVDEDDVLGEDEEHDVEAAAAQLAEQQKGSGSEAPPFSSVESLVNNSSQDTSDSDEGDKEGTNAEDPADVEFEIVPEEVILRDLAVVSDPSVTKKRKRTKKGQVLPECRMARNMGAVEIALRKAAGKKPDFIFKPVRGMVFDSREEAYQFFNLYSWEVGFGIRYGKSNTNQTNGYRTMQEIVCEKEGYDKRCTHRSKRSYCKAMIRLHRTEDYGWYLSKHVAEHNHPLSVSCAEKRAWKSHSKIEQCTKDMIKYLRENNVTLSRVHCIIGSMYGSMDHIPFSQRALRGVCAQLSKETKEDDWQKTLNIFRKMRQEDPGFQFSVDFDEQHKIKTLLWTSGKSRSQYNYFGDVITFDTTYCTNLYKMPFGIFVGVNNHFQTILYAGVLMRDESAKSFKWVFKEFLDLMGGKAPVTILTDQCKAMTKAIKEVLPNTTHLWCKWHILKSAPEDLGPIYSKKSPFREEFHYIINEMLTVDEFEKAWKDLLDRYNLHDHPFMQRTYKKREKWAKPWCKDKFCARMASTQRSESANNMLKTHVPRNTSMNLFVRQYKKLLWRRNNAESEAEHETKQFILKSKRTYAIEKHAMSIYTKKAFELFRAEVDKSTEYNVIREGQSNEFKVVHMNAERRKTWARDVFIVTMDSERQTLSCECGLFDHFGMLCRHTLKVLIHLGYSKIPEAHILKRWTRYAREVSEHILSDAAYDQRDAVTNQIRQGILYVNALEVVRCGEKDPEASDIIMKHLASAKREVEKLLEKRYKEKGIRSFCASDEDYRSQTEAESDFDGIVGNSYGASGSSAGMSDHELQSMLPPSVHNDRGRPRANRFKPMSEIRRKGAGGRKSRKAYSAAVKSQKVSVVSLPGKNSKARSSKKTSKKKVKLTQ